ncbi:hypothetical protein PLESTB_000887200 [Pleodorina starrii]|uniref:Vitamin K epoxide reductase domain-containing protein n=1 Tax=Pleodorina starrii TaxID=330485 RepID=A0A9W6BKH1_9CHLO|nr:hypothetical protein PLESTM_000638400 [Pleodorina starrii]GLC53921.1 hypothetical protein PLESTB_000804100 [Pleodorina starrii]GLC54611.1 hypothetical protein PLESTB_000887200 [Pleodorina starrii]GLC75390.1 hypothetical protein PLESTF_001631700 [Pleodorina starrii]
MSAATCRSAGAVSCSGRASSTAVQFPINAITCSRAGPWTSARKNHRAHNLMAIRSVGPDEVQSAPPLADNSPELPKNADVKAVPPAPINTSNFNAMIALASVGVIETAYLTYVKLFDGPLVCPTNGCESVLSSPYAQLFGLPLPLFGMLTYGAVGILAATYVSQSKESGASAAARGTTLMGLTAGVAALATTSAVLMSILQTRLGGTPCAWCYLSAGISMTLAVTLGTTLTGKQIKDNALAGLGGALATAAVLYAGLPNGASSAGAVYDENFSLPYRAPLVSTKSSDRAIDLARRLKAVGARMYGAFWCSHCLEQKEDFGAAAMADFPYVECFPNGWKRGEKVAPLCEAANVRAFPTWSIGGKTIEGELLLSEIEKELQRAEAEAAAGAPSAAVEAAAVVVVPAPVSAAEAE